MVCCSFVYKGTEEGGFVARNWVCFLGRDCPVGGGAGRRWLEREREEKEEERR